MSPDFHTEGQITCNPFLARLNTDNCWIAKEKVETRNYIFSDKKIHLAKRKILHHNQPRITS